METLLFDAEAVEENARIGAVIEAVEDAFAAYERGDATMPPKSYIDLPQYNGDFRAMPAYLDVRESGASASQRDSSRAAGAWDAAGLIMTSVGNYRIDRPTAGGRTGKTLH